MSRSIAYSGPMLDETVVAPDLVVVERLRIAADKEIDLLIKAIEEASKQTREVLLAVLATSLYILIAVFARSTSGTTVTLPLLAVPVSNKVFLAFGPALVLVPYLYLRVCIGEMRRRIALFNSLDIEATKVHSPNFLLFPFIITTGLAMEDCPAYEASMLSVSKGADTYPRFEKFLTKVMVSFFAPAILLVIWLRFIDKGELASLFSAAALIAVMLTARIGPHPRLHRALLIGASAILIVISVASVPELRQSPTLRVSWQIATNFVKWLEDLYHILVRLVKRAGPFTSALIAALISALMKSANAKFIEQKGSLSERLSSFLSRRKKAG